MWDRVPASQSPHSYRGDNRGHAPNIVSGSGRTVKKQSGVKRGTEGGKDLSKELTLSRDPKEVRARQGPSWGELYWKRKSNCEDSGAKDSDRRHFPVWLGRAAEEREEGCHRQLSSSA